MLRGSRVLNGVAALVLVVLLASPIGVAAKGGSGGGGASGYSYSKVSSTRSYTSRNAMLAGGATGFYVYSSRGTRYNGGRYRKSTPSDTDIFECKNGQKIVGEYICDRIDDCGDGSDERTPSPCQGKCSSGERAMHTGFLLFFLVWFAAGRKAQIAQKNLDLGLPAHSGCCNMWGLQQFGAFVLALSQLIILCVCAGEDASQEINWNITMLVFTGIFCIMQYRARKRWRSKEVAGAGNDANQTGVENPATAGVFCAPAPLAPSQPRTLMIMVPPGAFAGTTLQVGTPEGMQIQVQVPAGMAQGNTFMAQVRSKQRFCDCGVFGVCLPAAALTTTPRAPPSNCSTPRPRPPRASCPPSKPEQQRRPQRSQRAFAPPRPSRSPRPCGPSPCSKSCGWPCFWCSSWRQRTPALLPR
jgi:hypothetical protein